MANEKGTPSEINNALAHYGILGMHWGVRRASSQSGSVGSKDKKTKDDLIKEARRKDVKNRRTLNEKDLTEKIGRLEREKKLRELTEDEIDPGRKAAKSMMKTVGERVATTVLTGATLYAIKTALTGKVNIGDLAGYVVPKPGKK